jgi:hypothetical protein
MIEVRAGAKPWTVRNTIKLRRTPTTELRQDKVSLHLRTTAGSWDSRRCYVT